MKSEFLRVSINLVEAVIYYGGCLGIALFGFGLVEQQTLTCMEWTCKLAYFGPMWLLIVLVFIPWAMITIVFFKSLRRKLIK